METCSDASAPRSSLGADLIAFAAAVGIPLFDWQAQIAETGMELDGPGFAKQRVVMILPRRNGKTRATLARALFGCVMLAEDVTYTAHKYDTALETFSEAIEICQNSPWLARQLKHVGRTNGKERLLFSNGAKFRIRARTESGGRGLETDCLILDEGLELTASQMAALTPLLAKARAEGSGQIWVLSSAGHGRSDVLASLADMGRTGDDPGLAFFEWAAPRDADPSDPAAWAAANPSLGTPVLDASFLSGQRSLLDPEAFGREHLGWWTSAKAKAFLHPHQWHALVPDEIPAPTGRPWLGIESGADGTAVVAAVPTATGLWLEVIRRWPALSDPRDIVADLLAWVRKQTPAGIVTDRRGSAQLMQHLNAARMPVRVLDHQGMVDATGAFLVEVDAGRIHHPGDPQLDAEILAAGLADVADGFGRISRSLSTGPATAAFAAVVAAWPALAPTPATPRIITA